MAVWCRTHAMANFRSQLANLAFETESTQLPRAFSRFFSLFSTTTVTASPARTTTTTPNIGRLNHVAIAVPNLEEAAATYKNTLGAHVSEPQSLPEHGVKVVFVQLANAKLELLEPLGKDSPISGFLAKNPAGGMHHICLEVAMDHVRTSTTVRPLSTDPKIGAHGNPVFFLHPKDMHGVLTEFEEVKKQ
ncbi:putative Methylmalonyl-CoA epimerase, mitochondrial [Nannochloris sp. 'desiccata']|nr:hypothetical protein KSW81_007646 [Chlorella desiccata (nom. nud.)]KAH7618888.1 putative Methylmalonyl-CoA epimerase, mitochondrial [Chlorella desiccata (nom. nud.)]